MKQNNFPQDLIASLHNSRYALLRGLRKEATDEEKAKADILLSGTGEEITSLLEQMAKEPYGEDEAELNRNRERIFASLKEK